MKQSNEDHMTKNLVFQNQFGMEGGKHKFIAITLRIKIYIEVSLRFFNLLFYILSSIAINMTSVTPKLAKNPIQIPTRNI